MTRIIACSAILLIFSAIHPIRSFQVRNGWVSHPKSPSVPTKDAKSFLSLRTAQRTTTLLATSNDGDDKEYRNTITQVLSNFLPKEEKNEEKTEVVDPLTDIDFAVPKVKKMTLEQMANTLDEELYEREWFVTGRVNPTLFADDFQFQDPDVKLNGIEEYARGVYKLFDQQTSRAEIITTAVNTTIPNTITVTWRLSGRVNIGPAGLPIKPYIVYTDFTVDPTSGLITFQEDRFDLPGWDILLSALFPFLIGKVTAPPAPPVKPRKRVTSVEKQKVTESPLDALVNFFSK